MADGPRRRAAGLACAALAAVLAPLAGGSVAAGTAQGPPPHTAEPELEASAAVLWDPAERQRLWGRQDDEPRPMASLTKMLTALLLVEDADDLDETVTVSSTAAAVGQATVGLVTGQQVSLRSLVAGLMVESGNDAAVAVAEHVAGSEEAFVERMTRRAAELGADGAAFVNASGLTNDPAHAASPTDLARIATAAMDEPVIARFAAADAAVVDGLPPLTNRNGLLGRLPGADGVKTGFTAAAGPSLAGSATRDGWQLIAIVLDSGDRTGDAAELLEWGFANYDRVVVAGAQAGAAWRRGDGSVRVGPEDGGHLAATVAADAEAWWRPALAPAVEGPLVAGSGIGRAELVVDGRVAATVPLTTRGRLDVAAPGEAPAAQVGAGLVDAVRGLARAAPVEVPAPRRRGEPATDD